MSLIDGLDDPCGRCERPCGDHTLREWNVCMGAMTTHQPYAPQEQDIAALANRTMAERLGLEEDSLIADNIILRAATFDGASGPLSVKTPALIHEFSASHPDPRNPRPVAKLIYIGQPDTMRAYGRLARDSANGAANAAEARRAA